jgi:hypothetical protein
VNLTSKPESTVKLTAFALFKRERVAGQPGFTVERICGASAARVCDDGSIELLADSVPFHAPSFQSKSPRPGNGLLMLYGIRDALDEMQYWRTRARDLGAEFAHAEFEFAVGTIEVGLTDRPLLKAAAGRNRFLNVRRMSAALQSDVLLHFSEYSDSEGTPLDERLPRLAQIASRPDLYDKAFIDDADLGRLDILVIPVADDPSSPKAVRQVAYVRPNARCVSVNQGNSGVCILLPSWMTGLDAVQVARLQTQQP